MSWKAKTRGLVERLNHKLVITDTQEGLDVSHQDYGHLITLVDGDDNPCDLVRDILTEVSSNV